MLVDTTRFFTGLDLYFEGDYFLSVPSVLTFSFPFFYFPLVRNYRMAIISLRVAERDLVFISIGPPPVANHLFPL